MRNQPENFYMSPPELSLGGRGRFSGLSAAMDTVACLISAGVMTLFFWWTSPCKISMVQGVCAWLLLYLPLRSYLSWKRQQNYTVPLFALVSAIYWLYFGCALFYGDRVSPVMWSRGEFVSDEAITGTLLMAVLGVSCLWAGVKTPLWGITIPQRIPDINLSRGPRNYIRGLLMLGTLFSMFKGAAYLFGEGVVQLIYGLQGTVPLVAFIILFRLYLKGQASQFDKVLLIVYFAFAFVGGVASGWLGSIIFVALACIILYLTEKKRVPWIIIAPMLAYALFFQPGKQAYRKQTWHQQSDGGGIISSVELWATLSLEAWQKALNDTSGAESALLVQSVVMRTSLLTQSANVLELTPSRVPYQMGSTYSFLAAMWVPRALWPGKPSASEANRFYQVAYGITSADDVDNASFASGSMTEGYINFGLVGVGVVMYLIGLLFNWVQRLMLSKNSGIFLTAVGVTVTLNFLTIESQMAFYVGGLAQQVLLTIAIFWPILHFRPFAVNRSS